MTVELIDHSCKAEETIAQSAGICYGNDNKNTGRIVRLKQHKHLATFRFAHAVFKISDISRACQNQFVRSKHLDFLVESQRYVKQTSRGFVYPPSLPDKLRKEVQEHVNHTNRLYQRLLVDGVSKEDARSILPQNSMTTMYVAGNFQAWIDFLKLRVSKHAQSEIRQVAIYIWSTLAVNFPLVFDDIEFEDERLSVWEATL